MSVAAARHILRLAYYILRNKTRYEPAHARLRSATAKKKPAAA